jgi:hypothetical protein
MIGLLRCLTLIALLQTKQRFTGSALTMSRLPYGWKPRVTENTAARQRDFGATLERKHSGNIAKSEKLGIAAILRM